jgi:putative ABC transport system permease protein
MRSRFARLLARCLPRALRDDLFEPAVRDLEMQQLVGRGPEAMRPTRGSFRLRVLWLFFDCWRLAPGDALERRRVAERHRMVREGYLSMLVYHVRHAIRLLVRDRGFSTAAVLTLALGIGANVAVFAVLEAVVLRPLPYPSPHELVILNHRDDRTGITKPFIAIGDFVDLAARQSVFGSLDAYGNFDATVYGLGEAVRVAGLAAAPRLFETLVVRPAAGRSFRPEDARQGAAPVVMLGHDFWQKHLGGDAGAIGRSIRLGTTTREIIGVAPPGFRFPPHARADVIVPSITPAEAPAERKSGWTFVVARLKPGVSADDAAAQLDTLSVQMERDHPSQNQGSRYFIQPLRDVLMGDTKWALLLMQAAVGLVLLIACANVANLLLVRTIGRRAELGIRVALGAGRGRLASQLIVEVVVLATAAGLAGVAIAHWGVPALVALVPQSVQVPGLDDVGISGAVLAFAIAVSVVTAIGSGLGAVMAVRSDSGAALLSMPARSGVSRNVRRATAALVVAEVAIAAILLVGAGLILRSFAKLLDVNPGFSVESVVAIAAQLPPDRYQKVEARTDFYARAFETFSRMPGVAAAGAAVVVPLTGNRWTFGFERSDRRVPAGQRPPDVGWQSASGGYFQALGIPLRSGRLFDHRDAPRGPPVVIVSESIERQFFPDEAAVGKRVRLNNRDAEIVGVVGDIRRAVLTDEPWADMYLPFEQAPTNAITFLIRASAPPAAPAAIQAVLRQIEPALVFTGVRTLDDVAAEATAGTRLAMWLLGLFALVALVLAAIGVYGVMSYAVRQRTREISTRLALGATSGSVLVMTLRDGARIAGLGLAIGLTGSVIAARPLASLLFGVQVTDPLTLGATAGVLALTTLVACYLPARRAAAMDPARVLAET